MVAEVNMPLDEHFDGEIRVRVAPYQWLDGAYEIEASAVVKFFDGSAITACAVSHAIVRSDIKRAIAAAADKLAGEISWAAAFDKKRLIDVAFAEAKTAFAAA